MASIGKARHVDADLRQQDLSGQVANPGDRGQQAGALSDRRQRFSHDGVELGERVLQGTDDIQMQLEHRAMVFGNASAQCLAQFGVLFSGVALGQRGKPLGIGLAVDNRLEHGPATVSQHVREHAAQLEVGVFEHFLDTQAVLGDLAHELLAGAREIAQLLDGGRRHEA